MLMPFVIEDNRSEIIFRNNDSDFAGTTVMLAGTGPVAIEATVAPILDSPSEMVTKFPLANLNTSTVNFLLIMSITVLE